uniref:Uncharacterized protein n=1 Tax=Anopheles atroparvus TaxID=41427 RepID=A0A182J883_ANOAO
MLVPIHVHSADMRVGQFKADFRISKYCGGHLIVGNEVHRESLDGDDEEDDDDGGNDDEDDDTRNRDSADRPHDGIYAGSPFPSWRHAQADPTLDGSANGFANDARWHGTGENDAVGEDFRSASDVGRDYQGSPYRRTARAGEPRAEALQAATVHSFHNLKILKPIDEPELQHQQQQHHQQQHEQQPLNETEERNPEMEAVRNRNRQRQKVFSQVYQ